MTQCLNCRGQAQVYLCPICVDQLGSMLGEVPWMAFELEITRCRMDKLTVGSVRRSAETLSAVNVGAMELSREVEATLLHWVDRVCEKTGLRFLPPGGVPSGVQGAIQPWQHRLPAGYSASPRQCSRWLRSHVADIVKLELAGDLYSAMAALVGDPDHPDQPGRIFQAIDRRIRRFVGPCPTVVGHDSDGQAVECGVVLYCTDEAATTMTCPKCDVEVDIARNLVKAATERDLLPEGKLLEVLETLDEKVSRTRFLDWVAKGDLKVRGFIHDGRIVPDRIQRRDARVFSLSATRHLRWRHLGGES